MKAMILAAGEGRRMLPLTLTTPKPLLSIKGVTLLERLLVQLHEANITEVIINVRYLADKFHEIAEKRRKNWPKITISDERKFSKPLNTGGGIIAARSLLGYEPCLIMSGDIYTHFSLKQLRLNPKKKGHLILIPNPRFHPKGDFNISPQQVVGTTGITPYTYGNIGLFSPYLFDRPLEAIGLGALMKEWSNQGLLTGEVFHGFWDNVGTPEQLHAHNEV